MQNRQTTRSADRVNQTAAIPWAWLDRQAATAFTAAGVLLLASGVVPFGLKFVTDWAWVSGLVLVGLGFSVAAIGLFGLYPDLSAEGSLLPALGVLGGVVTAGAALGLLAMAGIALVGEGALGLDFGKPVGVFSVVGLSMTGGYATGSLSIGTAGLRSETVARSTSLLLLAGGAALLLPVVGEVLRRGFGIQTGLPSWLFLPVLVLLVLDSLAIGSTLQADE